MWNVTITEIQDANSLDPIDLPRGAFFVSTERFNKTVEHLDLRKLVSLVNRMQPVNGHPRKDHALSEEISRLRTDWMSGLQEPA